MKYLSKNKDQLYYVFVFAVSILMILLFRKSIPLFEIVFLFVIGIPIYVLGIYHGQKQEKLRAQYRTKKQEEDKEKILGKG
ncbi:MAG: hypothetical protein ACRCTW_11320 [Lactococcus garvieae]|jgi:hypothetical protein